MVICPPVPVHNASPSSSAVTVVDYATIGAVRPLSLATVLLAWLAPVLLESLGWLTLFQPYPGEGIRNYARNMIASAVGIPLFAGSAMRLVPVNSLAAYSLLAIVSWAVLLTIVTQRWARSVPLIAHVVLSMSWTFGGCLLYLAMCSY
jgi:hypothetical protein